MEFIPKTVKFYSIPLSNEETINKLEKLLDKREHCRNYFYSRFSGIEYMDKLNFRDIRNELLKTDKEELKKFNLSARTWKMELSEVIANIKSMWSNSQNEIKHYIRDNENLDNEDRHYLYYILKDQKLWAMVVQTGQINETKKLSQIKVTKDKKYLLNLLSRYTRRAKPNISHSISLKTIQLDTGMYQLIDGELFIQSLERGKRLHFSLRNKVTITTGNIRVILNKEKNILEVHKLLSIPVKKNNNPTKDIGIDKGYTKMLSSSEGNEYGIVLGELLARAAKFINQKNKTRNKYHSKVRKLKKELKENTKLTLEEKRKIKQKIQRITHHNLSNKSYKRRRSKYKEIIRSYINHEIKRFILTEKPTRIALEDLTFETISNPHTPNFNMRMSLWVKGYIDERLNYYADMYGIEVVYVSAAYTSKFCSKCGAKLESRIGQHKEIGHCPNCGEIDANINAAKNIKARLYDPEITQFTPYRTIEKILLERYEKKHH